MKASTRALLVVVLTLGCARGALASELVSITLEGSAATAVGWHWRVFRRGATWVAERSVDHGAAYGRRDVVGLMPDAEAEALKALLDRSGAFGLRDADGGGQSAGRATWRVRVTDGTKTRQFTVHAPEQLPDRTYDTLIRSVCAVVEGATPVLPFRDLQAPLERSGWLHLEAPAGALIRIDGVGLHERTPIEGLRVEAGAHTVDVEYGDGRPAGVYPVEIERGKTTVLRVREP
ncbi:MAG: hypothetical protein ACOYM9_10230 [Bradymonadia bacterium]|jgi:hypothetical protein